MYLAWSHECFFCVFLDVLQGFLLLYFKSRSVKILEIIVGIIMLLLAAKLIFA
ncbi:hypothetical protein [Campylobacter canis]|uniref:hypothetical protein n=1 Tax=Campylobacter canis TaxID=3378588 RepID=UPI003C70317C